MNEQLSAFLDGEATCDESDSVVSALLRDESLRDSWSRQHWIRTTLRAHAGEVVSLPDVDFATRVMRTIAEDGDRASNSAVIPITSASRRESARPRRWRGVANFGMAAAVAGVVLMAGGGPFVRSPDNDLRTTSASDRSVAPAESEAEASQAGAYDDSNGAFSRWNNQLAGFSAMQARADAQLQTVASRGGNVYDRTPSVAQFGRSAASDAGNGTQWSVADPAVRHELNGYLIDHNGMASRYGMGSTTPAYVRVAAYGQGATQ